MNPRRPWLWPLPLLAAVAGLGLGQAGYSLLGEDRSPGAAGRARTGAAAGEALAEAQAVRRELERMTEEVRALREEVALLRAGAGPDGRATADPGQPVGVSRSSRLAGSEPPVVGDSRPAGRGPVDPLEERFQAEPPDPGRFEVAEAAIRRALTERRGPVTPLGPVDCRATACRFEIAEGAVDRFNELIPVITADLAGLVTGISVTQTVDARGARRFAVYLQR